MDATTAISTSTTTPKIDNDAFLDDPILTPRDDYLRYVSMDGEYPELDKLARKAESLIWPASDVRDLESDRRDWEHKLTDPEREYLRLVLAFFAVSDGIVADNLVLNFATAVHINEAKRFYGTQHHMENVHAEVYARFITHLISNRPTPCDSMYGLAVLLDEIIAYAEGKGGTPTYDVEEAADLLLDAYAESTGKELPSDFLEALKEIRQGLATVPESKRTRLVDHGKWLESNHECALSRAGYKRPTEQERVFRMVETHPATKRKAEWALRWLEQDVPEGSSSRQEALLFAQRLVAFAAVEMIFFSSSFAAPTWLRSRGLMLAFATANDQIRRDEGLHGEFAAALFAELRVKPPPATVWEIVTEAVRIEMDFVRSAMSTDFGHGMSRALMCQYVQFVGDFCLRKLAVPDTEETPHYGVSNPLIFMELLDVPGQTAFFERTAVDYSHTGGASSSPLRRSLNGSPTRAKQKTKDRSAGRKGLRSSGRSALRSSSSRLPSCSSASPLAQAAGDRDAEAQAEGLGDLDF